MPRINFSPKSRKLYFYDLKRGNGKQVVRRHNIVNAKVRRKEEYVCDFCI